MLQYNYKVAVVVEAAARALARLIASSFAVACSFAIYLPNQKKRNRRKQEKEEV